MPGKGGVKGDGGGVGSHPLQRVAHGRPAGDRRIDAVHDVVHGAHDVAAEGIEVHFDSARENACVPRAFFLDCVPAVKYDGWPSGIVRA